MYVQRNILELFWNQQLVEIYNTSGSFPIKIIDIYMPPNSFFFSIFEVSHYISLSIYFNKRALKIIVLFPISQWLCNGFS